MSRKNGNAGSATIIVSGDVDGIGGETGNVIDPASVTADATGTGSAGSAGGGDGGTVRAKRKYTRRAGSVAAEKAAKLDISGIETLLLTIHHGVAALTKIPEAQISPEEANAVAKGAANVARHYEIGGVSQKYLDWFALITTLGTVYGSRVVAYNFRVATEAQNKNPESFYSMGPANVGN